MRVISAQIDPRRGEHANTHCLKLRGGCPRPGRRRRATQDAHYGCFERTRLRGRKRSPRTLEESARGRRGGHERQLNTQVESFPANLVAERFGFDVEPYFEIEDPADRSVPQVSF